VAAVRVLCLLFLCAAASRLRSHLSNPAAHQKDAPLIAHTSDGVVRLLFPQLRVHSFIHARSFWEW
jgi:hypothetical protein